MMIVDIGTVKSVELGRILPQDHLDGRSYPDLLALQQVRVASLLRDLGLPEPSRDLIREAQPLADRYGTVMLSRNSGGITHNGIAVLGIPLPTCH
jgi:hypothetical protein